MPLYELLLKVLATYAISLVITQERGPFAIFSRLQSYLATKQPKPPEPPSTDANFEQWQTYQADYLAFNEANEYFHSTLWGYAYNLSSCPICLGAYASLFIIMVSGGGLIEWLATYGGHLVLVKMIKE